MTDLTNKTTEELRRMASCLRHPTARARYKEVLAEIERREDDNEFHSIDEYISNHGGEREPEDDD